MVSVGWLTAELSSVPGHDGWLGPRELPVLAGLRFAPRRRSWRLGRWTAKRALAAWLGLGEEPAILSQLEVVAAEDGAPDPYRGGERLPLSLSLSHRQGLGLAAVAEAPVRLGCDLEWIEPRSAGFVADYFTAAEQGWAQDGADLLVTCLERDGRVALVWSAKESALKALRVGLRADTRSAEVRVEAGVADGGWRPLSVATAGGHFAGLWRRERGWIVTVAASSSPSGPLAMRLLG